MAGEIKFDGRPPETLTSAEAEDKAFAVWETASRWAWKDSREREASITSFSAGWIACEQSAHQLIATKDAELSALREERDDAVSTLTAWFDMAAKIEAEAVPVIMGGLRGYIRTARNGGMPDEYAAPALAVLEDYCKLQMGRDLVPVLRGMAAALTHQEKDAQDV